MTEKKKHIWRADITGLRAVAVLPVVLYHAFPGMFPGGYVGVDVFFVISGYLISGILFRQLKFENNIDFLSFYGKRIRRIFPNLIALLFCVSIAGYIFLYPDEYVDLARQIYSSAVFIQNFRLLSLSGNYFAPVSERQPLLHLWSLSIEEQFYIIFPLLCYILWKIFKTRKELALLVLISSLSFVSLFWCILEREKIFDFYFPLTRFWELGFGICLSYGNVFREDLFKNIRSNFHDFCSCIGFLLIALPVFFYSKETAFPGVSSIPPVLGAVLLIFSGPKAVVNAVLAKRSFVVVGLISYSWYLWHWPIIVFGKILSPDIGIAGMFFLIIISAVISVLIYKFVETPARTVKIENSRKATVAFVAGMVLIFSGAEAIRFFNGLPERSMVGISADLATIPSDWTYPKNLMKHEEEGVKYYYRGNETPEILVLGDSHAEQYESRLVDLSDLTNESIAFITSSGCPLVENIGANGVVDNMRRYNKCQGVFKKALRFIEKHDTIKKVVLANNWGNYAINGKVGWCVKLGGECIPLEKGGFSKGFEDFLLKIQRMNKKIFIILDVPWDRGTYDPLSRISRIKNDSWNEALKKVNLPLDDTWEQGNKAVTKIAEDKENVVLINPVPQFCKNQKCNILAYKDANHLRSSWVRRNATWVDLIFEEKK